MTMNKKFLTIFFLSSIIVFVSAYISFAQTPSEPDQGGALNFTPMNPIGDEQEKPPEESISDTFKGKKPLITVNTYVDKSKITVGDKLKYTIEVTADKNIDLELPGFAEFLGGFAITDYNKAEPKKSGSNIVYKLEYTLDVYLPETYAIPPARITYTLGKGNDKKQIFTAPIFVTVESVLQDEDNQLRDIKPVETPEVNINKKTMAIIIGCSALLIAIIIIAVIIFKRRKNYVAPPIPAHIIAFKALEEIKAKGLVEAGEIKEYYFLISNVLRHYIENRFDLMAPEWTTEEFLQELSKTTAIETKYQSILEDFLTHCDIVKFAKYNPSSDEINKIYLIAVDFIEQTKQADEPDEEEIDENDQYDEQEDE
ncbi:hypothetical protein J7L67_04975 [bacterium]|nr:hypothetical protein [bacterium]